MSRYVKYYLRSSWVFLNRSQLVEKLESPPKSTENWRQSASLLLKTWPSNNIESTFRCPDCIFRQDGCHDKNGCQTWRLIVGFESSWKQFQMNFAFACCRHGVQLTATAAWRYCKQFSHHVQGCTWRRISCTFTIYLPHVNWKIGGCEMPLGKP